MKYFPIAFFLLCLNSVFSQETNIKQSIDELKQKIELADKGDKLVLLDSLTKLTHYNPKFKFDSIVKETIAYAYELDSINLGVRQTGDLIFYYVNRVGNAQEGLQLFKDIIAKDLPITDTLALSYLYGSGADSYFDSGFEQESITLYEKAEVFSLIAKDSTQYARYKAYKGFALSQMGEFAKASQEYQKALSIFLRRKDSANILKARIGLSILYGQNDFYYEAEKEHQAIDSLSFHMKEYGPYLVNLGNRANNQYAQKNYTASIKYNKKQLEIIKEFPHFQMFEIAALKTLANSYVKTDSLDLAKSMLKRLKEKVDINSGDLNLKRQYLEALTQLLLKEEKYEQARITGEELLKIQEESTYYSGIMGTNKLLYIANEKAGNSTEALNYLKEYITIKDSIESTKKVNTLSYYQTLYEMEKRDSEIKQQQSEISLLDQENKVKNQWLLFGGLGLFLGSIVIYLIRSRNFSRKEKQNQELFSQELIKAQEDQRTEVARDLHDSVGQKLMLLTKKVKSFNDTNVEQLAKNTLEELRGISRGLYPATFERVGVTESIQFMINEVDANTNLFFISKIDNIDKTLSKQDELHLYRIIQEILNNIVKHANAKSVFITITKKANTIETIIKDNGIGFEFAEKLHSNSTIGMKTLLERAKIIKSKLLFDSNKNEGTTMELITPIS